MKKTVYADQRPWHRLHSGNSPTVPASRYVHHAKKLAKSRPGTKVVLFCRVSTRDQNKTGNLRDQELSLRRAAKRLGLVVVDSYHEVTSGWIVDLPFGRTGLTWAAEAAKENDAIVLAESTDRFLRNRKFNSKKCPDLLPTKADFEELRRLTWSVTLATLLDPDTHPREVRAYETRRGQKAKGKKGGRPKNNPPGYKKRRRASLFPRVVTMHERGASLGEIASAVGVPRSTIQGWVSSW